MNPVLEAKYRNFIAAQIDLERELNQESHIKMREYYQSEDCRMTEATRETVRGVVGDMTTVFFPKGKQKRFSQSEQLERVKKWISKLQTI